MARTATVEQEPEQAVWDVSDDAISDAIDAPKINVNGADVEAILKGLDLGKLIEQQVAEQVAKATAEANLNKSNQIVDATQRDKKAFVPQRYLKHYRCDVSPDITIQVRTYDPERDTLTGVTKGKRMQFRRGHFFATEQSEVDQIEWMMRHPSLDPSGVNVIGGNPTIYEDDGKDLVKCAYCEEVFVVGSNSLKSHLRATHGVAID